MNTQEVIALAREHLRGLVGHRFDILEVVKPVSPTVAVNLVKIISKLSPLVGNLIDLKYGPRQPAFLSGGRWPACPPCHAPPCWSACSSSVQQACRSWVHPAQSCFGISYRSADQIASAVSYSV